MRSGGWSLAKEKPRHWGRGCRKRQVQGGVVKKRPQQTMKTTFVNNLLTCGELPTCPMAAGRRRRRRLRLLHRQFRLQGHGAAQGRERSSPLSAVAASKPDHGVRPPGHEALAARGRQDHDHAAVHHRQGADPQACAERRADPPGDRRFNLSGTHQGPRYAKRKSSSCTSLP